MLGHSSNEEDCNMAVELYSLLCFAEMELGLDLPCVLLLQHQLLPAHHHTLDQCAQTQGIVQMGP
jgi:hypothetical protein